MHFPLLSVNDLRRRICSLRTDRSDANSSWVRIFQRSGLEREMVHHGKAEDIIVLAGHRMTWKYAHSIKIRLRSCKAMNEAESSRPRLVSMPTTGAAPLMAERRQKNPSAQPMSKTDFPVRFGGIRSLPHFLMLRPSVFPGTSLVECLIGVGALANESCAQCRRNPAGGPEQEVSSTAVEATRYRVVARGRFPFEISCHNL